MVFDKFLFQVDFGLLQLQYTGPGTHKWIEGLMGIGAREPGSSELMINELACSKLFFPLHGIAFFS
jgi:hypothetical protein